MLFASFPVSAVLAEALVAKVPWAEWEASECTSALTKDLANGCPGLSGETVLFESPSLTDLVGPLMLPALVVLL